MRDQSAALVQSSPGEGSLAAPRSPAPVASEQALFRPDLLRSLQLHRRLALGIALLGLVGAVAYVYSIWPVYTADATIYVQPAPPKVMDNGYTTHWPFDTNTYESFISQQMVTVTRGDVLANAVHKMEPGWQHPNESDQEAAVRLGRAVDVKRMGTSYQLVVSARSSNPITAAHLANAVANSYIESETRESKSGNVQRKATLQEEKDRVQKELDADRAEQQELNKKLGVAAAGATPDHYDEDLSRMRLELIRARAENDAAASALTSMDQNRAASAAALDAEADQIVSADPGLVSMKTTLYQRRATLTSQMANLTPNHPLYKQDAEELSKINRSIDSLTVDLRAKAEARIQQRLKTELERTSGVEARLNAQLGQMAGAAASATPKMQRENDLAADILRLQNRYTAVDEQLHNLALESSAPGASYLAAAATPPLSPTKSGVLRNALVIAFAGLFFGLLAAIGANKLDQKVYIASDVEQVLGFAPLAVLPDFDQVSDGVAEEHLLRLSAGIEYARQQGNLKSCIFTGAGNGVGVTTVSSKVRSMLEGMGRTTVLVDASGTPPPAQRSSYAQAGREETSSQLAVQRGSRSTALVQQLTQEAETQEGSLVLTDTAPLAVSAETEYLARFVDAAIVVVESGVTTRKQLREAAETLQRLDVSAVGFVLNRVGLEKADPSFRESVQAIEDHLHAQSLSYSRTTERSQPPVAPSKFQDDQGSREVAAPAKAETALPRPSAEAPMGPPMQAVTEAAAAPAQEARFEPRVPKTSRVEDLLQPASHPVTPYASRPFVPEKPPVQQSDVFSPAEPAQPVRGRDPQVAARRAFTASDFGSAVRPGPAPQPPPSYSQSPWAESWKRVAPKADDTQPQTGYEEPAEPGPEETPYDAATRMSGLRNLIFSLGLKNAQQAEEGGEHPASPPPPVEPVHERPVYAQVSTSIPEAPVRREAYSAPTARVVAAPEILPPRTIEVNTDTTSAGTTRRDRREAFDDVQILPSWRGQYRKR
jgi:Mrp family chromosome partitioning ATPase/uncharacterized protein involved in exopolysaccharide biosynthesis